MANQDEERRRRARNRNFVGYDERNTPYDRDFDPDYSDEQTYQNDLRWRGRWDSDQGLGRDFSRGQSQRYPNRRDRDDNRPDEIPWTYDNERNRQQMVNFYGPQSADDRWWDRDAERHERPRKSQPGRERYGSDEESMSQNVDMNDRNNWMGPYSGVGPKGYQRPDYRIMEEAAARLALNGQLDASNISLGVSGGIVTLEGTVPDRRHKRLAEDSIESIHGVKDVDNQIKVNRQ